MALTSLADLGAKRFLGLDELTVGQRQAAVSVLRNVHDLAEDIKRELDEERPNYDRQLVYRHPRWVFVIDGNRGSGKTTLLLTLHHLLGYLGAGERAVPDKKTRESLSGLGLLEPSKGNPMPPLVLSILNPNEMERGDDTMENIFAQITTFLREKKEGESKVFAAARNRLEEKLHGEVAVGWSFSRDIGVDTLSRDSLDYKDFVKQRAEQATRSYTRQQSWRKFVDEFLDQFSRQLLVICIDDTDLAPSVTEGILHAIRMYLSHPRVVVLLCMNLSYIRHTLEMLALQRISEALRSLSPTEADQARWQERRITHEYLYKILPPSRHLRLTLEEKDLDPLYRHYVPSAAPDATWKQAIRQRAMALHDAGNMMGARGWHLFYDRGQDLLTALPLREVCEFIRRFPEGEGRTVSQLLDQQIQGGPTFTRLLRRLQELSVPTLDDLLGRQDFNISWIPAPIIFNVAGMKYRSEDPEFRLIGWLIDHMICADPLRPSLGWLPRLLPQLSLVRGGTAATVSADSGKLGLAAYLLGSPVPRNCLYFRELIQITDILVSAAPPEAGIALQGDWAESLREIRRHKNAALIPAHINQQLNADAPDEQKVFQEVVDGFQAHSLVPELHSQFRLPALWLLFHLVQGTESHTPDRALHLLRSWGGLAADGPMAGVESQDSEFSAFLIGAQRLMRSRPYSEQERQNLLTCALRIATDTTGPGTMPNLENLLHAMGTIETRPATLLLWSIAPILPEWLESGIASSDIAAFRNLSARLESVVADFQNLRESDPFVFLDIPEETQDRINDEISRTKQRIEALLAKSETVVIPVRETDPFTLSQLEQIAYILRISPIAAERFVESVKPPRG